MTSPSAPKAPGVLAAAGFRAAGTAAGIKPGGVPDLAVIVADRPVAAAAVFTSSLAPAPPVELDRERVASGEARAIIVNSGIANAATGGEGRDDAEAMGRALAEALACPEEQVLVCSTGVIGPRVPVDKIVAAVPGLVDELSDSAEADLAAARAIMTTDSVPKHATFVGDGWTLGGIAKGAGMLRPDMATMLAFLTTDADVDAFVLRSVLSEAVMSTFNCLNVDGCQSTNDTTVLLAGGASGVSPPAEDLAQAVETVCRDLALQMARDAEGASKVVHIEVSGAATDEQARRLGSQVADSALVRSAFFGADPNWGRVLAALGVAGVPLDQSAVSIAFEGTVVCRNGVGVGADEDAVSIRLAADFTVAVSVGDGPGAGTIVTTDLTPDYVLFNGERS